MKTKVLELLSWAKKMMGYDASTRVNFAEDVLESLKKYSEDGEGGKNSSKGKALYEWLTDQSQFEKVGFIPNVMYIKINAKDKKDLKYLWVHPFGSETLLFMHKKLPIMVIANPMIRFNKTVLSEMKISKQESQILGISG